MLNNLYVNGTLIDDEFIKKTFIKDGKFCSGRTCWLTSSTKELYVKCRKYLEHRFDETNDYKEALYRIINGYIIEPTCPICGKTIRIIHNPAYHYNKYCSITCRNKDEELIQQSVINMKKTLWDKYQVTAAAQLPTNVFKTNHPMKKPEVRKKVSDKLKEYNKTLTQEQKEKRQEHYEQVSMEKYGFANPSQHPAIKEKIKQRTKEETQKRYGVDTIFSIPEIQKKAEESRYRNNHGPKSDIETKTYKKIAKIFPDATRHWNKDERYPFRCDIYIPSLDVFIECQYFKSHGGHPFDPNNLEDLKLVKELKNDKTVHFDYKTFSINDVKKRELAKKNKLIFFEIWAWSDVVPLIYKLKEMSNMLSEEVKSERIKSFNIKKALADEEYKKTPYYKQKQKKLKKEAKQ